jgi:hypothetical protein
MLTTWHSPPGLANFKLQGYNGNLLFRSFYFFTYTSWLLKHLVDVETDVDVVSCLEVDAETEAVE